MAESERRSHNVRRYAAEAFGTFTLVAIGPGAAMVAASTVLVWLLGPVGNFGATVPALSVARSFVVEAGYSAILAFVTMAVATDERTPAAVAPFALGAAVFAGALVTGPLTGGSFNPARSLGPAVVGGVWTAHWLYWLAPITGMAAAMHLYEVLRGASAPAPTVDLHH
ncbi:MAG: aquaporin [Gemmatimonadaceae bacterium]